LQTNYSLQANFRLMNALFKKLDFRHRNNKQLYYLRGVLRDWMPRFLPQRLDNALAKLSDFDVNYIRDRVNYYNHLSQEKTLSTDSVVLENFRRKKKFTTFYFDTFEYTRFFPKDLRIKFVFGDVLAPPAEPAIVKYRPIEPHTDTYVLLKLNKVRLFNYSTDNRKFEDKKNMLIGRAVVKVAPRVRFYEKYFNHPMCDLGQINRDKNLHWVKDKLTIDEHLDYKFVLCLEGYDIASNLRWVMSSHSLAVMPKPTFDSWYMERRLIPNYHYVEIKADYSDLEERLNYYIQNPDEASRIIKNANEYARQFQNEKREDLISLLVLEKYFYKTGQKPSAYAWLFEHDGLPKPESRDKVLTPDHQTIF
jgi:hypothetical protein